MASSIESETLQGLAAQETAYNWAAMFTAFASGSSLEDIAATFACPMPVLRRAATVQDWAAIASRLVTPAPAPLATPTEARMAVLEANRSKNYQMADMLRDRLIHDFTQLRLGTLKVEKALMHKGDVVHTEVDPGPQDMVALANAAKSVADMTYRALGDVQADESRSGVSKGEATSITVILPTVVNAARPLEMPAKVVEVVDLRTPHKTIDEQVEENLIKQRKNLSERALDPNDGPPDISQITAK